MFSCMNLLNHCKTFLCVRVQYEVERKMKRCESVENMCHKNMNSLEQHSSNVTRNGYTTGDREELGKLSSNNGTTRKKFFFFSPISNSIEVK